MEALRLECNLPSFELEINRMVAMSAEKAARLPDDHPRSKAYKGNDSEKRLHRDNWRCRATDLLNLLPPDIIPRVPLSYFMTKPWVEAKCLEVYPE